MKFHTKNTVFHSSSGISQSKKNIKLKFNCSNKINNKKKFISINFYNITFITLKKFSKVKNGFQHTIPK